MQHPLTGRKKTRQHRDRIRASMLRRYARIRTVLGVESLSNKTLAAQDEHAGQ